MLNSFFGRGAAGLLAGSGALTGALTPLCGLVADGDSFPAFGGFAGTEPEGFTGGALETEIFWNGLGDVFFTAGELFEAPPDCPFADEVLEVELLVAGVAREVFFRFEAAAFESLPLVFLSRFIAIPASRSIHSYPPLLLQPIWEEPAALPTGKKQKSGCRIPSSESLSSGNDPPQWWKCELFSLPERRFHLPFRPCAE